MLAQLLQALPEGLGLPGLPGTPPEAPGGGVPGSPRSPRAAAAEALVRSTSCSSDNLVVEERSTYPVVVASAVRWPRCLKQQTSSLPVLWEEEEEVVVVVVVEDGGT